MVTFAAELFFSRRLAPRRVFEERRHDRRAVGLSFRVGVIILQLWSVRTSFNAYGLSVHPIFPRSGQFGIVVTIGLYMLSEQHGASRFYGLPWGSSASRCHSLSLCCRGIMYIVVSWVGEVLL